MSILPPAVRARSECSALAQRVLAYQQALGAVLHYAADPAKRARRDAALDLLGRVASDLVRGLPADADGLRDLARLDLAPRAREATAALERAAMLAIGWPLDVAEVERLRYGIDRDWVDRALMAEPAAAAASSEAAPAAAAIPSKAEPEGKPRRKRAARTPAAVQEREELLIGALLNRRLIGEPDARLAEELGWERTTVTSMLGRWRKLPERDQRRIVADQHDEIRRGRREQARRARAARSL